MKVGFRVWGSFSGGLQCCLVRAIGAIRMKTFIIGAVTRDGNQIYTNTFRNKIEEKTGFLTSNGAAWSTSKHRDEVRLCAEHALDQTLNDVVSDSGFLAAIK